MHEGVREDWHGPRPDNGVLEATLARLEAGWVQKTMFTEESCCLVGALYASVMELGLDGRRSEELLFHLGNRIARQLPPRFEPSLQGLRRLFTFNDTLGRTQGDVVAVVRRALLPASGPRVETESP
jgi:hypothetical protein